MTCDRVLAEQHPVTQTGQTRRPPLLTFKSLTVTVRDPSHTPHQVKLKMAVKLRFYLLVWAGGQVLSASHCATVVTRVPMGRCRSPRFLFIRTSYEWTRS